jgi:hypothetical protein
MSTPHRMEVEIRQNVTLGGFLKVFSIDQRRVSQKPGLLKTIGVIKIIHLEKLSLQNEISVETKFLRNYKVRTWFTDIFMIITSS